jgi:hypothetical protein
VLALDSLAAAHGRRNGETRLKHRAAGWLRVGSIQTFASESIDFERQSLVAIFQFPFRLAGDQFDMCQRPVRRAAIGTPARFHPRTWPVAHYRSHPANRFLNWQ